MISLRFERPHRSIRDLPNIELPNFAVITGVNGSGKTHLIEAIETGAVGVHGVPPNEIKHYDWTSLVPTLDVTADPLRLGQARDQATNQICKNLAG